MTVKQAMLAALAAVVAVVGTTTLVSSALDTKDSPFNLRPWFNKAPKGKALGETINAAKAENADACVAEAETKLAKTLEKLEKGLIFTIENLPVLTKDEEEALRTKGEALGKTIKAAVNEANEAIIEAKNAKADEAKNADACVVTAKIKVAEALEEINKGLNFMTENLPVIVKTEESDEESIKNRVTYVFGEITTASKEDREELKKRLETLGKQPAESNA